MRKLYTAVQDFLMNTWNGYSLVTRRSNWRREMRAPRSQTELNGIAEGLLSQHGLASTEPVKVIALANALGIQVYNANFADQSTLGQIEKNGHEINIFVRNSDHWNRKRFTIAHELGHYWLHLKDSASESQVFSDSVERMRRSPETSGVEPEEIEANRFAAALLMPAGVVLRLHQEGKSRREIARRLEVSEEALGYRFEQLGIQEGCHA